jgi:hypothetical protein
MPEDANFRQNDENTNSKSNGIAIGSDHAGKVPTYPRLSEVGSAMALEFIKVAAVPHHFQTGYPSEVNAKCID